MCLIVLNNIQYEDTYDGSFTQRRAVIYTLQFTALKHIYLDMNNSKVIKTAQSDLYTTHLPLTRERIVVMPNLQERR